MSTASVYSLAKGAVSLEYAQSKGPVLLEERAHFKAWAGNIQDEPGTSCGLRDQNMLKQ